MLLVFAILLMCAAIYGAAIAIANRRVRPKTGPIAQSKQNPELPLASDRLSLLTWNIGYASLGKEADLIIDQGKSLRALSTDQIATAASGIAQHLANQPADVLCLQENANAGFLTRNVPVRDVIATGLSDRISFYWTDMKAVLVPRFLRFDHGMSVHARVKVDTCSAFTLPQDNTRYFGLVKKFYGGLISRIPTTKRGSDWVIFNIHLSAFDPNAQTRLKQLAALLDMAQREYEKGHFVVVAGDWNMRLSPAEFPHQTLVGDLTWTMPFSDAVLPKGWRIAVDSTTPTVRTLNARYVAGENYTTIIDGFVHSPNVAVLDVSTADLGFELSDHHPVFARFQTVS